MLNRPKRALSKGVTLFELAVLLTACGALARLAIPNFYEFRKRAADASAHAVFEEIKESLQSLSSNHEGAPIAIMLNQKGKGGLPAPFSKIEISDNIRVNYLISLHYPGFFDITALEVSHDLGSHYYRMIWANNKRIEQVLAK